MKVRKVGTLWQNWAADDSKFHINQLWPQIMLSIWGTGTWEQRQQAQKHWNEMEIKTLYLPNPELPLRRYLSNFSTSTPQQLGEDYHPAPFYIKTISIILRYLAVSMTQVEGAFKVHKNQSWQLSKPLLIVLCAMQNVELNLPFTNKKTGGKHERLEWEKVAAEGSKSVKVILCNF